MGHHALRERFDDLIAVIRHAIEAARPQAAQPPLPLAEVA